MTVDTANSTLGASKEMDESTLSTVFDMRVSEIPPRGFLANPHSQRLKNRPVRRTNYARRLLSLQKLRKVDV